MNEDNEIVSGGIKAVIFDLGNVLIDFDHRMAAKSISIFTDKTSEEVFNLFFDSKLTGLFEEGKMSPPQFFEQVRKMLGLEISYHQFVPIWNEIFFLSERNLGVYQLACSLRSSYKFAVLSNINILHLEYIKRTFPFLNTFPMIASCELGLRKPHVEIYQKALQILDSVAGNVFYADDRAELVASASKLGMHSFIFKDVEGLRKDLITTGINLRKD